MLADLWNAPDVERAVGVATIGSSEAIMLGLLAHKFSWRKKREDAGLPADKPNVVFGAETHIVWDKFARYFDVEPRKVPMREDEYVLRVEDVAELIDENTIAVGAVLGTTFIGENDPIEEPQRPAGAHQGRARAGTSRCTSTGPAAGSSPPSPTPTRSGTSASSRSRRSTRRATSTASCTRASAGCCSATATSCPRT